MLRSAPDGGCRISVLVQPRASRSELAGIHGGRLKIRLCSPPVDGRANEELLDFVRKKLGIGRASISLTAGEKSRQKEITVHGLEADRLAELLELGCQA